LMGVLRPIAGQPRPAGERPPTTRDLMTSGGATMEALRDTSPQRAAEVFVEFDHRLSATGAAPPFLYSYGERVPAATLDTFEPFVRRAESHARAHQARFDLPGPAAAPFAIGHRQWYLADNLVTVELQLRPEPPAG
jgi:hypothetical protein